MTIFIGMTVFNGERHLRSSLISILEQTNRSFALVIVDDGSSDASWEIITEFKDKDSRIHTIKHNKRKGAIATWKEAFDYALEQNATFFAWASDHDLWDLKWLELLSQAIEKDERIALVYPQTIRIDDDGLQLNLESPKFETEGLSVKSRIDKLRKEGHGYGDMIYGLFRMSALKNTGIYRRVLLPDTVTIWEISLVGTIIQINENLWYRRYVDLFSLERQKRTLFVTAPWYTYLPYWLINSAAIVVHGQEIKTKAHSATKVFLLRLVLGMSYGINFFALDLKSKAKFVLRQCFRV